MLVRVRGKKNPYIAGGNVNWYDHYGNQYGSSQKAKNRLTLQS
jgi:hypothetical protein